MTRVAALQTQSTANKARNLELAEKLFLEACRKRASFVCFPENFAFLVEGRLLQTDLAETPQGPTLTLLKNWAKSKQKWILAGSILLKSQRKDQHKGKMTNTSVLISPAGKISARYNKIHLFDVDIKGDRPYRESNSILPGSKVVVVKTPFGRIGMSVCYDLRFPELYRKLSKHGAEILTVPSAFTQPTGKAHWHVLLRARAIENQAFVIAPAQGGKHNPNRKTFGHSMIIDPWGEILAERKACSSGVIFADIDLSHLREIRKNLPSLKHRVLV